MGDISSQQGTTTSWRLNCRVLRNRNHSAMETDGKISPETRRRTDEERYNSETFRDRVYVDDFIFAVYGLTTLSNFGSSISPKKIYIILWTMFRHTLYSVFVKNFFCNFYRFLKKLCFKPKKVDEKSSNGHNFPLLEPNCNYLSILERSCYVEFEKNVTKKVLGKKMNRVTSCSFFSAMFKSKNKYECHF
jgi:hypothetical protein